MTKQLTKEECLETLESIQYSWNTDVIEEGYEVIRQLINEHFDNPPLKIDELKIGEWYWDKKKERWLYLAEVDIENRELVADLYFGIGFEENRFYRKGVKENEE